MLNLQGIHTEKNYNWCVCVWFEFADICAKYKLIKTNKNISGAGAVAFA